MKASDFMNKCREIFNERGFEYSSKGEDKERSFQQVADCFYAKTGIHITAAHVCLILQDLKDVRQFAKDRYHEDSIIDCINYALLKGEELYRQYENLKHIQDSLEEEEYDDYTYLSEKSNKV